MTIPVRCADCDKTYQVKPELAGKRGKCPRGHTLLIPAAEEPAGALDLVGPETEPAGLAQAVSPSQALAPPAEAAGERKTCPSCWAEMKPDAVLCVACGLDTRSGRKHGPPRRKKERAARSALPAFVPWLVAGLLLLLGGTGAVVVWVIGQAQTGNLQKQLAAVEQKGEADAAEAQKHKKEAERLRAENGDLKVRLTATELKTRQAAEQTAALNRRVAELEKKPALPATPVVAAPPRPAPATVMAPKPPAPPAGPPVPTTAPSGGKFWTAPKSVTAAGTTYRAGSALWIWPVEDQLLRAEAGRLVIRFQWRLRPGQTMPDRLHASLVVRGSTFTLTSIGPVTLEKGALSGTATASFTLRDLRGIGTAYFCLSQPEFTIQRFQVKVCTNLLALKASF